MGICSLKARGEIDTFAGTGRVNKSMIEKMLEIKPCERGLGVERGWGGTFLARFFSDENLPETRMFENVFRHIERRNYVA